MSRRKRLTTRQLEREKLLFRYSTALERGDFETVQAILHHAESDPVLDQMIGDVNEVYRAELPLTALQPTLSLNSYNNHRNTGRNEMMTTHSIPIYRTPPTAQTRSQWSLVTLAVAVLVMVLFGAVLSALQKPPDSQEGYAAFQAVSATPTPLPTLTFTPSPNGAPTSVPATGFASTCFGVIQADPHAELYSMPNFDGQVSTIVGYVLHNTQVSILQEQSSNDPNMPFTWYLIMVESDGGYFTGWTTSTAVQVYSGCYLPPGATAPIPTTIYPCETLVSPISPQNITPFQAESMVEPLFDITATPIPAAVSPASATLPPAQGTLLEPTLVPVVSATPTPAPAFAIINPNCMTPTPTPLDFVDVLPGATPVAGFDAALRDGGYVLVTTGQVGNIPAGTLVRVSSAVFLNGAWMYTITTQDNTIVADAFEYQLRYAPDITPGAVQPAPLFSSLVGMGNYSAITVEPVGSIPAGTPVRLSSMWWDGRTWVYQISDENGNLGDAREYQLQPAPNVTLGAPTPTAALFGISDYYLVTLVDIGAVPAGTLVQVTSGYYNGTEWVYGFTTKDGSGGGEALASQLAVATDQLWPTIPPLVFPSPVPNITRTFTPFPAINLTPTMIPT